MPTDALADAAAPGRAHVKPRYRAHVDYDAPRAGYVLSGARRRLFEVVQLWGLPFVGWPLGWWSWQRLGYGGEEVTLAMGVPAVVMWGVVYWGTQVRELWTFPVPYAPGGYLPQIGLVYAATLHLCYLACAPLLTLTEDALVNGTLFTVSGGVLGGLTGCLWDFLAVKHDLLRVYVGRFRRGEPPGPVVAVYGPKFFTTVATVFAAVTAVVYAVAAV